VVPALIQPASAIVATSANCLRFVFCAATIISLKVNALSLPEDTIGLQL
jgi:hypothetical protein